MFTPLNWTSDLPNSYAYVEAKWTIHDAGEYSVYAYPEFIYCSQWKPMKFPWNKASVQGVPFKLIVNPNEGALSNSEGYGVCSPHDIENGRYLSTDTDSSPSQFANMFVDSQREFLWAPYKCKVPPRSIAEAIDAIPSAKHIVFIGDSTTRGPFCAGVWEHLHGTVENGVCDYKNMPKKYWEMKKGHKFTLKVFEIDEDRHEERNISFSFLWLANNFSIVVPTLLSLTDPPPTHVIFNMGTYTRFLKGLMI